MRCFLSKSSDVDVDMQFISLIPSAIIVDSKKNEINVKTTRDPIKRKGLPNTSDQQKEKLYRPIMFYVRPSLHPESCIYLPILINPNSYPLPSKIPHPSLIFFETASIFPYKSACHPPKNSTERIPTYIPLLKNPKMMSRHINNPDLFPNDTLPALNRSARILAVFQPRVSLARDILSIIALPGT